MSKQVDYAELIALCDRAGVSHPLPCMVNNKAYLLAKWNACTAKLHQEPKDSMNSVIERSYFSHYANRKSVIDYKTLAANDS